MKKKFLILTPFNPKTSIGMSQDQSVSHSNGSSESSRRAPRKPVALPGNSNLYCITSGETLSKIREVIESGYGPCPVLRIMFSHRQQADGSFRLVDSNKTIAVLNDETYRGLCESMYDTYQPGRKGFNMVVKKFELFENNMPKDEGNRTLFVPVPQTFKKSSEVVREFLNEHLSLLADYGVIPEGSWDIKIPLKDRDCAIIKNGCFIKFSEEVPVSVVAVTRMLVNDTKWPEDEDDEEDGGRVLTVRCKWARTRKPKVEGGAEGEQTQPEKPVLPPGAKVVRGFSVATGSSTRGRGGRGGRGGRPRN